MCDAPEAPVNTTVTLSNGGSLATYTCGIGYSLIGSSQRSCLIDGTGWEGIEPICSKYQQKLTLCILMYFPVHTDTISMGLLISYFKW